MGRRKTVIGYDGSIANRPLGVNLRDGIRGIVNGFVYGGFPLDIPLGVINDAIYSNHRQREIKDAINDNKGMYGIYSVTPQIRVVLKLPTAGRYIVVNIIDSLAVKYLWPTLDSVYELRDLYDRLGFFGTDVHDQLVKWAVPRHSAVLWAGKVSEAVTLLSEGLYKENHLIAIWPGVMPFLNRDKADKAEWKCKLPGYNEVANSLISNAVKEKIKDMDACDRSKYMESLDYAEFAHPAIKTDLLAKLSKVFPRAYMVASSVAKGTPAYTKSARIGTLSLSDI